MRRSKRSAKGTDALDYDASPYQVLYQEPYQEPVEGGPWGNRANLPRRDMPDFIRIEAEALREIRGLNVRLIKLVLLIRAVSDQVA